MMNLDGLDEVKRMYDAAELALKRYERICLENNPEVLGLLREASAAILEAGILAPGDARRQEVVEGSYRRCAQALATVRIDAMAGLLDNVDAILNCEGLEEKDLKSVFSDWSQIKTDVGAIRLRWSSEEFADDTRNGPQMEADYQKLQEIRERLSIAEPQLRQIVYDRLLEESQDKQRDMDAKRQIKQRRTDICALAEELTGGLSVVLTVVSVVVSLLGTGWKKVLMCIVWADITALLMYGVVLVVAKFWVDHKRDNSTASERVA